MAKLLVIVYAVTDYKDIGDIETKVVNRHRDLVARGFVKESAYFKGSWLLVLQIAEEKTQGYPCVYNVFNNQDMPAPYGSAQTSYYFDFARTLLPTSTVAGEGNEFHLQFHI